MTEVNYTHSTLRERIAEHVFVGDALSASTTSRCGDTDGGIDVVRLQVQAGTKRAWRPFRPKHCAILVEIDGTGHRPFAPASGGIMDIFLGASTTAEFPRST